jgi:excisionase family DNA binding protein
MDIPPLAVSIPEACRLIGVGKSLAYELIRSGQIATVKLGRRRLIPMASLQAFVTDKTEAA